MAHAKAGPVMIQEAVPAPAPSSTAVDAPSDAGAQPYSKSATAGASTHDDDDDDRWESGSLYEDILDHAEEIEYSADGQ